jgi:2-dehydro-3-deoxygluconokinase
MTPFDVVTFGETMIRLSPPDHQTFEQATSVNASIGGTESNTAITLSRLGMKTAWISKLVNNPLGRKISTSIAAHGVDISGVVWTTQGRNAVYFVELGASPRPHRVTYDRKNSAVNTLKPSEVNWPLFKGARVVHLTGITPALSQNCRRLIDVMIERARKERSLISFDVNYRAKLWSPREARKTLSRICSRVDILFSSYDDAVEVFGIKGTPEEVSEELASRFGCSTIVVTLRREGAICRHKQKVLRSRAFAVTEVDRVGAGDTFSAGFIFGYLTRNVEYALDFATAISALKFTIPGDVAWLTKDDVEATLNSTRFDIQR